MAPKPSHKSILLTLSFLSHLINSQTGVGCYNQHVPCPEPGQVRINALFHPTTGAFIGGCNCGCDFHAIYDPLSPLYCPTPKQINYNSVTQTGDCSCNCPTNAAAKTASDCKSPHLFNSNTCTCECPQQIISFNSIVSCPLHQIFNYDTCQCECQGLGAPGFECLNVHFQTIQNSQILPDCSCQCPPHSPSISDCEAMGRKYELCQCQCPMQSCQHPNQVLNHEMCQCQCPDCPPGEVALNEFSCECGRVEIPTGGELYCCQPMISGFAPYFGRCWGISNPFQCNNEEYGRCKWDVTSCFPGKPQCKFRDYECVSNTECCSRVCRSDKLCR